MYKVIYYTRVPSTRFLKHSDSFVKLRKCPQTSFFHTTLYNWYTYYNGVTNILHISLNIIF